MARANHFGDCAGTWNRVNKQLFSELGMRVPYEALAEIRRIRAKHGHKQGNSEMKAITRILLAIRQGMPWQHACGARIDYLVPQSEGGTDTLDNMRLVL